MAERTVLVTGASGLVGRTLGQRTPIVPLPRREPEAGGPWWDPAARQVHDDGRPIDAVVHLAGENVAAGRWTARRRAAIRESRVAGTRTLVDWIEARPQRPQALVSASAIGIYGDRGDETLHEEAAGGEGFLAEVCERWEAEARRAETFGVRVVQLRLGLVLSRGDGVLGRLEPIFRLGAGGPVGCGRQWFPWVHVDDVVGAILWALESREARGAYNVAAPGIVQQAEFARGLAEVLHRPALLPTPAFALRLAFGDLADEALLASQRVVPKRLLEEGFAFRWPELSTALASLYA
jgi:uncharacterized protein (TIGR01777 family)